MRAVTLPAVLLTVLLRHCRVVGAAVLALAVSALAGASLGHAHEASSGGAPVTEPPARGTLVVEHYRSKVLRQDRRYLVYEPPGYAAGAADGRRYPVLYVLHAAPSHWDAIFKAGAIGSYADRLIAQGDLPPMLIVAPDGKTDRYRSDTEWANTPAGRFEDYVPEVVTQVDSHFSTDASRQGRALAGFSEGGYGALNIALHHLRLFSVAESWSGYYRQWREVGFSRASDATLAYNSPYDEVNRLRGALRAHPLAVFLYKGAMEPANEEGPVSLAAMTRRLRSAGVAVKSAVVPGQRHSWQLWREEMPAALEFAGATR